MDGAPHEILLEILSPLLKYSDGDFSDTSEKPILRPASSTSSYLLVSKQWLQVATPLLYHTVILRTTAQAAALAYALKSNPEMGSCIKRLRIEGGFGKSMLTIFKSAPNIVDLYFTLILSASEDSRSLSHGLAIVRPRRVILYDAVDDHYSETQKPRANKQVTQLFDALCDQVPKWNTLLSFVFPYVGLGGYRSHYLSGRAAQLAAALAKSPTIQYVDVGIGRIWPTHLDQLFTAPSFRLLRCHETRYTTNAGHEEFIASASQSSFLGKLHVPEMKPSPFQIVGDTIVRVRPVSPSSSSDGSEEHEGDSEPSQRRKFLNRAGDLVSLQTLAASPTASTLEDLDVDTSYAQSTGKVSSANPTVLAAFPALVYLRWRIDGKSWFTKPDWDFRAFENMKVLEVGGSNVASILNLVEPLDLPALSKLVFNFNRNSIFPLLATFVKKHGNKLLSVATNMEFIMEAKVLELCPNLEMLGVHSVSQNLPVERRSVPPDFFSSKTHAALKKVYFDIRRLDRHQGPRLEQSLEALDPVNFPALEEIQLDAIQWPTAERDIAKNKSVALFELLRGKGIKLVDARGVSCVLRERA